MSTKTTKRKRATAAAPEAAVEPAAVLEAMPVESSPAAATAESPSSEASPTIRLSSNCTVKDAGVLKEELLRFLDAPSVAIDAKSVERMDTATMQLLCAFVRDRADRNLPIAWGVIPQTLREAARLLGIGSLLALPTEATP